MDRNMRVRMDGFHFDGERLSCCRVIVQGDFDEGDSRATSVRNPTK